MATALVALGVLLVACFCITPVGVVPASETTPPLPFSDPVLSSTRRRLWLTFALAGAAGVALFGVGFAIPSSLGLLLAMTPGVAASIALTGFIVYPSPRCAARRVRSASLERRTPSMFLSRRAMIAPSLAATGIVLFLIFTGMTSARDEAGLSRATMREDELGLQIVTPFPGWYYGAPLIALTLLLCALTIAALYRVAAAPTQPDPDVRTFDMTWRARTSQLVVLLSTVTLLSYFVGVLAFAGNATRSVAVANSGLGQPVVRLDDALLGRVESFGALALTAVAVWLTVLMVVRMRSYATR